MKKIIQILLILALVLMTCPTYATDTETAADLLLKYKFIAGDNGDPMVEKALTRAEVAVIIAEMNGVKDTAAQYKGASGFSDVAEGKWYTPYVAYGKANDLLGGYPDGTFKPEAEVTSREFAAFLMNAMGYKGDYEFDNVTSFSASKNVWVDVKGVKFVRGDAFDALWSAVNQPAKGSTVPIGVKMGKLPATSVPTPVKEAFQIFDINVNTAKSIQIQFENPIKDTSQINFSALYQASTLNFKTSWDATKTTVTLSSPWDLNSGDYIITISDISSDTSIVKTVKIEPQKVSRVELDSNTIERFNDYIGTIGYTVYDQYGVDITNSTLGRNLNFVVGTDHPKPIVNFEHGTIIIQKGARPQSSNTLRFAQNIALGIIDTASGFSTSFELTPSLLPTGIHQVEIKGIIDQNGNNTELIYSPTKDYYLDLRIWDSNGRQVVNKDAFDQLSMAGQELLLIIASDPFCEVTKTVHPTKSGEVAYKITFKSTPNATTMVTFLAQVPEAIGSTSTSTFTTKLIKE
ncbi:S-layer homology domain-containing protein [Fusibacter ferrireducens]|uniref:S-layer homology domain-containing protein n=1 Tax=Fusibacter ferrireducens TaxID=2785058 RepID=A0ABR9ZYT5_9FIRM|nr:S-layer homology domain-containing protein [Fusibacter ferrireducens]MBF4695116.1 S-layer homology domain-containing protein [Fusibacter ferrireducens]